MITFNIYVPESVFDEKTMKNNLRVKLINDQPHFIHIGIATSEFQVSTEHVRDLLINDGYSPYIVVAEAIIL